MLDSLAQIHDINNKHHKHCRRICVIYEVLSKCAVGNEHNQQRTSSKLPNKYRARCLDVCIPAVHVTPACSICSARSAFRKLPIAHTILRRMRAGCWLSAGSPAGLHKSLLLVLHAHRLPMSQTTLTVGSESSGLTRFPST